MRRNISYKTSKGIAIVTQKHILTVTNLLAHRFIIAEILHSGVHDAVISATHRICTILKPLKERVAVPWVVIVAFSSVETKCIGR